MEGKPTQDNLCMCSAQGVTLEVKGTGLREAVQGSAGCTQGGSIGRCAVLYCTVSQAVLEVRNVVLYFVLEVTLFCSIH